MSFFFSFLFFISFWVFASIQYSIELQMISSFFCWIAFVQCMNQASNHVSAEINGAILVINSFLKSCVGGNRDIFRFLKLLFVPASFFVYLCVYWNIDGVKSPDDVRKILDLLDLLEDQLRNSMQIIHLRQEERKESVRFNEFYLFVVSIKKI